MVVAANTLAGIDNEVFAPGRFDIKFQFSHLMEIKSKHTQMIMQHDVQLI